MIGRTISHYKILAKLGEGGMGVVFKAEDLDLKVSRALKFLPPSAAASEEDRVRLEREARAAASLEHPNICQVHEIGRADDQTFIVMSYLEGQTLADRLTDRLADEGPLPVAEALTIATEVGGALSRAHAAGVVHRDIKPANIMLTDGGQAVVMDFGLAQATDLTRMTRTGTTLGTAAYMSPEQARGQIVDARTDIWSLGVVLYEMLTGRQAFGGDHLAAVAYAVQHEEPTSLTQVRPDAPADLERVIGRALAKDPQQRYQTADELLRDLEAVRDEQQLGQKTAQYDRRRRLKRRQWSLYGLLATVVIVAIGIIWWSQYQDSHRIDALAVLPFANLSGDAEQEYFADGMTDALITELQQIAADQLRVIGRTSVMSFKNTNKTLPEIAAELGVDVVVEASVIRSGDLVKVAAKLIRARPEEQQLWAATYERKLRDILTLHAEVAREVAAQIQLVLSPEAEARLSEERTVDPEAYEAYLKGRYYLLNLRFSGVHSGDRQSIEEFHLIGSFFTKSIRIDSTYAPAWAGLAEYHIQREHGSMGPDATPKAFAAATKAIELDDTLGEAHAALAHILWEHQYKPREAGAELRRALELNPNDPWAHALSAYYLHTMGRFEESARAMLRATELDPLSRFINMAAFHPLMFAGWYDEAIHQIEKTHETYPDWRYWRSWLADVYKFAGRYEEGLAVIEEADPEEITVVEHLQVPPLLMAMDRHTEAKAYLERYKSKAENDSLFLNLGYAYACIGDLDEARKWLDEAEKAQNTNLFFLAKLAVMVGDPDRAFAYLEQAYENRHWFLMRLATHVEKEPDWQPLADDPRYHDLVRRLGVRD